MTAPNTLYVTLQYLRTVNGENDYHWGLLATGDKSPAGHLYHVTDNGREPLDISWEVREILNPAKLSTMVACLKIASAPSMQTMCNFTSQVPVPNPRYLPRGAAQGTSRIWVKEALDQLHRKKKITLPVDVDTIEWYCKATAERNIRARGSPQILNDLTWLGKSPNSSESEHQAYYGSSRMVTETRRSCYELS